MNTKIEDLSLEELKAFIDDAVDQRLENTCVCRLLWRGSDASKWLYYNNRWEITKSGIFPILPIIVISGRDSRDKSS